MRHCLFLLPTGAVPGVFLSKGVRDRLPWVPVLEEALFWVFFVGFAGVRFTDFLDKGDDTLGLGTGVQSFLP